MKQSSDKDGDFGIGSPQQASPSEAVGSATPAAARVPKTQHQEKYSSKKENVVRSGLQPKAKPRPPHAYKFGLDGVPEPKVYIVSVCDGIGAAFVAMQQYTSTILGHACEMDEDLRTSSLLKISPLQNIER